MASKKVAIQIGFVTIRTKMEVAVDEESRDAFTVCIGEHADAPHAPTRVKQSFSCPECGESHSSTWGFPKRAVETLDETGNPGLVVVDRSELEAASGALRKGRVGMSSRSANENEAPVELAFHSREKVFAATVAGGSVQNIYPDAGGEKAYALLRDALRAHRELVGVMIWAPSTKNALWVLDVVEDGAGGHITASKRCWPEQMRATTPVPHVDLLDAERAAFTQIVEASVEDFDLLKYANQAKQGINELVASRSIGSLSALRATERPNNVDLLSQLQATLEQRVRPAAKTARRSPAKKTTAKKATSKTTRKTTQPRAKKASAA